MRELRRGQIKKIIEHSMKLAWEVTDRDSITLEDIYKIAEAVKGSELTTREKKIIAGIVTRYYPAERHNKLTILIVL